MRVEVIAIGDELTSGQRLDTNSQWLSERLGEVGAEVMFHTTVGDDLAANIQVFQAAFERAEVVVSTGGLGPTADDLTREAMAAAVGVELIEDAALLAHIRGLYAKRGRVMPERNALQALLPAGAEPIPNPRGTAPGVAMRVARSGRLPSLAFALPGVPAEMHEMWAATVRPQVEAARPAPLVTRHRRIKCFGVGESNLEEMLPDLIRRGREPRVGITASKATLTLRVTATAASESDCDAAMAPTLATIRETAGDLVFGEEDDELQDVVVRLLAERGESLAVADAATGGLLAYWLAT
ncbi:MAG: CinA family nicotinamide mononucleotide deamidase-related protein, partial [Planctomycetota bacterium]